VGVARISPVRARGFQVIRCLQTALTTTIASADCTRKIRCVGALSLDGHDARHRDGLRHSGDLASPEGGDSLQCDPSRDQHGA
jgi:hypothetical protein